MVEAEEEEAVEVMAEVTGNNEDKETVEAAVETAPTTHPVKEEEVKAEPKARTVFHHADAALARDARPKNQEALFLNKQLFTPAR